MEQAPPPPARSAAAAFGAEPRPWRKRLLPPQAAAPKGAARTVGAISGGLGAVLGGALRGTPFGFLAGALLLGVPGWALERHYRGRRRREREQLLPPA